MRIQLGTSDFNRALAGSPAIRLVNRYFERSPQNQKDQVALLSRPGLRKWKTLGTTPVRAVYSQPGTFEESLFAVAGNTVYIIEADETVTSIGTLTTSTGGVSMAATDTYLYIADGSTLKSYTVNAYATGTLTATGVIASGDVVKIGSVFYSFTSGSVDTGSPQGTTGNPWLVKLGANNTEAIANLAAAIEESGDTGDYSLALTGHTAVAVNSYTATTLVIRAIEPGTAGNAIATTETGANIGWGATTLAGGGATAFATVTVPDNDGIISVGVIAGYVICVVAQGQDKNGRFYWIEPGETTIDALNFATAERSPDPLSDVLVVGDQFWLLGTTTTEVWYPTGSFDAPMLRQQGRLFDKGIWPGTAIKIKDDVIAVGTDGVVYRIGAAPEVISTPGISQRLREAINAQRNV